MESAKIPHHHQQLPLQDQHLASSTTLDHAPGYAAPGAHVWTSNAILNFGGFDSSANAAIFHSRNPRLEHDILVSSLNGSITHQDLSFNWPAYSAGNSYANQSSHESQLSRIKRELSNSCPNLSEMISSPSSSIEDAQLEPTSYGKNDPNAKLLLSTLSSGGQNINGFQSCSPEELIYCATSSSSTVLASTSKRGTFSQIYPTINVSNFSQTSLANSSSFDMNLRASDLLSSARPGADFRRSSLQDQFGASKNSHSNYRYDYVSQSIQMPAAKTSNITSFSHGGTEEKSSSISSEPKAPQQQSAQKRPRLDQSTRPSCQPFKVRKEKLGDRIAALQQLVAPFGKTDTASVLMEAIGYIKFLQNQVETLSVPHLKSSRNKTSRAMHGGPAEGNGSEERKPDLKSRGMCLVPVSCLSYMTDTGGSVWPPPPSFGGGT